MRNKFSAVVFIAFVLTACKKDVEKVAEQPMQTVDGLTVCSVDDWNLAGIYRENSYAWTYNNKVYTPDYYTQKVNIFDGSNWTSVSSAVPVVTTDGTNFTGYVYFTLGSKGYLVMPWHDGTGGITAGNVFEYNILTNVWRRRADFPGPYRYDANSFTVGNKGYIVSGRAVSNNSLGLFDTWEYNPTTNAWRERAHLPLLARSAATGFSIGNKGYLVGGLATFSLASGTFAYLNEMREYDPATNSWSIKASIPGTPRKLAVSFIVDDKVYVGGGRTNTGQYFDDFYRYNPSSNTWSQVTSIKYHNDEFFGFTINSKGYVVSRVNTLNAIIEYTPAVCTTLPGGPIAP